MGLRKRSEVEAQKIVDEFQAAIEHSARARAEQSVKPEAPAESPAEQFIKGPRLSRGFERIVERTFDLPDPLAEYDELEKSLKLGEQRSDYGSLVKGLDEAEDNALRAHKLWCCARVEQVAFDREFEVWQAPIWATSTAKLQEQKDKGARAKAITDADVRACCAEHYPEEYRENATRAERVKLMVDRAKELAELWKKRCGSLQSLLENRRK
jgi:hypothetical protein